MAGSNLTGFPFIAERSEATPGLWNAIFSQLSENIAEANNISNLSSNISTLGMLTLHADSNVTNYIYFDDTSGSRSDYIIGSQVGGTADGLNIYDASGATMIASFSKQSVRFYQNVVGPVFDISSDFINVATHGTGSDSTESRIQSALNQSTIDGKTGIYLPRAFYPYSASSISFIHTQRIVREGGNFSVFDLQAYGASDLNVTSASSAFDAAMSAASEAPGGVVYVPSPVSGYKLTVMHTTPRNIAIVGESKHNTRLVHSHGTTMIQLALGVNLENLWFDGNGSNFSGPGLKMFAGGGKQTVRSVKITDFSDYCVDFSNEAAGSQSLWDDVETWQSIGTGVGQEAVAVRGSLTVLANPRTFIGVQTEGKRFMDFGPCNNIQVVGSRIGDCSWQTTSLGVTISTTRYAGTDSAVTIFGASHAVVGCHIKPKISIGAGVTSTTFRGNAYDNPGFIDAAISATNVLEDQKSIFSFPFAAFSDGSAIPDVSQGNFFQCNNTSTTTITFFANGVNGQQISIRLDANTGIQHNNSNIRLNESRDLQKGSLLPNDIITFTRISGIWFEESRSFGQTYFKTFNSNAILPEMAFNSEVSLGWYRSAASTMALSYGTLNLRPNSAHLWASGISIGNTTAGGTLIPAISSMSSLVAAFVVQPSASSFTVVTWTGVQPGDQILTTVMQSGAVSSLSSGLVLHSHCTQANQIEFRLSNVSTLAQNQSSRTYLFTRITPF